MRYFMVCFTLSLWCQYAFAQDFNYTVVRDSVQWQELTTQVLLHPANESFLPARKIPVGFTFNYLGSNFDSLTIEKSGLIVFDDNRRFCFWGLVGFTDTYDSHGNGSVCGYELSGIPGSRKLTLQFKNVAAPYQPGRLVSYQVQFHENGDIEFIMGPHDLIELAVLELPESIVIGLVNQNMDTATRALTVTAESTAAWVDDLHPDFSCLSGLPNTGTRFFFTVAH